MPSLQGKAEFSFSHRSIICKERRRRGGQKKSAILAPQAARQPAYTPEWHTYTHTHTHTYTHIVTPPHQPLQFAAKKPKGEVFHTHTTN